MIDMFSLILGFVLGAVSVIVGFLLPTSRRTKRAVDGANVCPDCETTSNMYRCESCGCQWSPRN